MPNSNEWGEAEEQKREDKVVSYAGAAMRHAISSSHSLLEQFQAATATHRCLLNQMCIAVATLLAGGRGHLNCTLWHLQYLLFPPLPAMLLLRKGMCGISQMFKILAAAQNEAGWMLSSGRKWLNSSTAPLTNPEVSVSPTIVRSYTFKKMDCGF